jgi:hypothetical protein
MPYYNLAAEQEKASSSKTDKEPYAGLLAQPMPKWTILTGPTYEEIKALIRREIQGVVCSL